MYQQVEKDNAEASAWVFTNPETFEKYYFKHP